MNNCNEITPSQRKVRIILLITFILLVALYFVFIVIDISKSNEPISYTKISEINIKERTEGRDVYLLEAGTYEILNEFHMGLNTYSSPNTRREYPYFNVVVTDGLGNQYIMAVKVYEKAEDLRNGKSIDIKGNIHNISDNNIIKKQLQDIDSDLDILHICLTDIKD